MCLIGSQSPGDDTLVIIQLTHACVQGKTKCS